MPFLVTNTGSVSWTNQDQLTGEKKYLTICLVHDLPPLQKQMSMISLIYFKFGFEPYEITNHDCSTHTNTIHPLLTAGPIGVTVNLNTTYDICGTCSTKVKFELSACERLGKKLFHIHHHCKSKIQLFNSGISIKKSSILWNKI